MMINGVSASGTFSVMTNIYPYIHITEIKIKFSQCRAGNIKGLPLILPLNLPKATTDPEKVIAPIKIPT